MIRLVDTKMRGGASRRPITSGEQRHQQNSSKGTKNRILGDTNFTVKQEEVTQETKKKPAEKA